MWLILAELGRAVKIWAVGQLVDYNGGYIGTRLALSSPQRPALES
jgi:hypothetical protein